jgi:hypothetical protein
MATVTATEKSWVTLIAQYANLGSNSMNTAVAWGPYRVVFWGMRVVLAVSVLCLLAADL